MPSSNRSIVLASKSPRRRELLKKAGIKFRVIPSGISEESDEMRPDARVIELALRKARAVAKKIKKGIVLGADTIVVCGGKIIGQPSGLREAYDMLYLLSGTTHEVYTGVALVDAATGREKSCAAKSRVRMKKLPIDELLRLSRKNLDKAGAYAIQEKKDPIARVISGSYDNVVGLPVKLVRKLLKKFY